MTTLETTQSIGSPSSPPRAPGSQRRMRSVGRNLWWFVLPAVLLYVVVVVSPTAQGAYMSLTNWSAYSLDRRFVGLDNFVRIFQGDAGTAALRTLFIALVAVVAQNVLGLLLALLLNGRIAGRNVLRSIIFAPMLVSPLVCGYLFKYIFGSPDIGAINSILKAAGLDQVDFLARPGLALWVIVFVVVWQFTGSTMVIYLAGLQNIPPEQLEAAALDGAGTWQRFWYVIRPLLAPAITINLMLGLISGLKLFDQIFAITAGGPAGKTETISTLIYQLFSQFGFYGRSAALAVVLTIGVAVLSLIQFAALRRQERKA
ncbi:MULTISPECIES: carbohydrate ABC transporter permease [unclassified Kribbella]|uniref:carbohydrate ABC transporter permease n=1 Tax=unclassified Kribbella TaxID=2644121 RepID=UPI00301A816A